VRIVDAVQRSGWTFLTNHTHVLICLARDPDVVLRDVASQTGITERAVQKIVADLEVAGVITRLRVGRRNRYVVQPNGYLRHPLVSDVRIAELVDLLLCLESELAVPTGG